MKTWMDFPVTLLGEKFGAFSEDGKLSAISWVRVKQWYSEMNSYWDSAVFRFRLENREDRPAG